MKKRISSVEELEDSLLELLDDGYKIFNIRSGKFDPIGRNFAAFQNPTHKRANYTKKATCFTLYQDVDRTYYTVDELQKKLCSLPSVLKIMESRFSYKAYCFIRFTDADLDAGEAGKINYHVILEEI
jgi:hypothetical protein